MTQRMRQGIISCELSNELSEHGGLARDPHSRFDSNKEEAEMGSDHRILVLAQGIEP
jgi:hypothetical protein